MLKNFIWAFVEKGGQFVIQFLSVIILSRFVSPEEFGIYGIMAIFISVSELLVDSGFGGALIQKRRVEQIDINTLFIVNFGMSIFLYVILFCSAPLIAGYYEIPKLQLYIRVLGLAIVFYSLTIVHQSLLQRDLRFKRSANITLIASIISVVGAIIVAYCRLGIWALIVQPVLMAFSLASLLWISEKRDIQLTFSKKSFDSLWAFGSKLLVANLLQTIYSNVSTSIIPKIANVKISGYYYQASRLNSIPIGVLQTSVDKAAFPILSKEDSVNRILERARIINKVVVSCFFPFFPLISLFSKEILAVVLGVQWLDAAPFLSVLSWGGWGLLLQALYRNIYKSIGNTKTILMIDLVKTLVGLSVLVMSVFCGVTFMIWGLTMSMYIGAILYMWKIRKDVYYTIKKQLSDFCIPVVASVLVFGVSGLIYSELQYQWYNIFMSIGSLMLYVFINIILGNQVFAKLACKSL